MKYDIPVVENAIWLFGILMLAGDGVMAYLAARRCRWMEYLLLYDTAEVQVVRMTGVRRTRLTVADGACSTETAVVIVACIKQEKIITTSADLLDICF